MKVINWEKYRLSCDVISDRLLHAISTSVIVGQSNSTKDKQFAMWKCWNLPNSKRQQCNQTVDNEII